MADEDLSIKYTVPPVPKLKGRENLRTWETLLEANAVEFGFENHYKATIPEPNPIPENASTAQKEEYKKEHKRWRLCNWRAWTVIRNSIEPVLKHLEANGYNDDNRDPFILYTAVQNTIKRVNASSKQAMMDELSEIRASNYPTILDFHLRFVELRRELSALKQIYDDDWCVNRVMKAMESVNPRWVEAAKFQQMGGTFTYTLCLEHLTRLGDEETMRLQLSATANDRPKHQNSSNLQSPTNRQNQSSSHPANPNNNKKNERWFCERHRKWHSKDTQYHDKCNACHPGGDTRCFKLHPELKDQQKDQPNTRGIKQPSDGALTWNSNTLDIDKGGISQGAVNLDCFEDHSYGIIAVTNRNDNNIKRNDVLGDSAASANTFNDLKWFTSTERLEEPYSASSANGGRAMAKLKGQVQFKAQRTDGQWSTITIAAVYNPDSPVNLLSDGTLRKDGLVFDGFSDCYRIKLTKQELFKVTWKSNVRALTVEPPPDLSDDEVDINQDILLPTISYEKMHRRLLHANVEKVIKACRDAGIPINETKAREFHCKWCYLGKSTKVISRTPVHTATAPLQYVEIDTIPHKPMGRGRKYYATHIIDRYSGYHWIFFSYSKTEIFQSFQIWIEYIEGQTVLRVQIIQIDDGTEFCPKEIRAYCEKKGIAYRPIVPLSSEMNGPIEKAGRWIMDLARTTLLQRNCPQSDWPYAEAAAVHVINFIPSDRNPNGECPHTRWSKGIGLPKKFWNPPIKSLKPWGCDAYVHVTRLSDRPRSQKMSPKAVMGKLYMYEGNKIYLVKLNKSGKILRVKDVRFNDSADCETPDQDEKGPIFDAEFDDEIDENEQPLLEVTMGTKPTESSVLTPTTGTKSPDYPTGLITPSPTPSPAPISSSFSTPIEDSNNVFDPITDEEYQQMKEEDGPLPPVENNNAKKRRIPKRPYQIPDNFVARRSSRDHKVTEGQHRQIASYGIDDSARPSAKNVVIKQNQATSTTNASTLAVYQPNVSIPPYVVNIPTQPTRGVAPYLLKNNWDTIKQPDYKEQSYPVLSAQVKRLAIEDTTNETLELVKLPPTNEVALGGQWILNQRKGHG